ncbi:hypothetical protein [Streptomyces odontomachi]|uniref:hypothetical protein n=1 Tax=Streptomyces odontomachi TaxID=2944940 RepID=UPI00210A2969|nr:hypothetical protein [Streptomyces sp. ODS25]
MSYDLAVWQGNVPSSNREAVKMHEDLYRKYLDDGEVCPTVSAIAELLAILSDRWPDRDAGEDTPWASTPLSGGASGPYVYITLAWSGADVASAYIAQVANRLGLVCFDPQLKALRLG